MYGDVGDVMCNDVGDVMRGDIGDVISSLSAMPFRASCLRNFPQSLRVGSRWFGMPCYGFPLLSADLAAGFDNRVYSLMSLPLSGD